MNNTKHNIIGKRAGSVMGATIGTGLATAQINKIDPLSKNVKSVYVGFFLS